MQELAFAMLIGTNAINRASYTRNHWVTNVHIRTCVRTYIHIMYIVQFACINVFFVLGRIRRLSNWFWSCWMEKVHADCSAVVCTYVGDEQEELLSSNWCFAFLTKGAELSTDCEFLGSRFWVELQFVRIPFKWRYSERQEQMFEKVHIHQIWIQMWRTALHALLSEAPVQAAANDAVLSCHATVCNE